MEISVILGLAASLRRASFHRGIVRAAHEVAPEWMSCDSFDLGSIPYFNQDLEDQGIPEPVRELREKLRTYDAVLIATPEYDYAIPGVLASALDWCLRSRHDPTPFRHKPVGIAGASPGGAGTARGQMVLRQILLHAPAYVMPEPQMLIPFSREKFDGQTGDLVDEETRKRLRRFLTALVEWTAAFRGTEAGSKEAGSRGDDGLMVVVPRQSASCSCRVPEPCRTRRTASTPAASRTASSRRKPPSGGRLGAPHVRWDRRSAAPRRILPEFMEGTLL